MQDLAGQAPNLRKLLKKNCSPGFQIHLCIIPKKYISKQSSSEITAAYKAGLVEGSSLLDLTGGFGVDTFYFSKKISEVIHCEINPDLSEVVKHNFKQMQINNCKVLAENGLKFLSNTKQKFDWIFADPSRRNEQKNKVFLLQDCEPDIPRNIELLFDHADRVLLKLSPILDITATLKELKHVRRCTALLLIMSSKNCCWFWKKAGLTFPGLAVNIQKGNIEKFEAAFPLLWYGYFCSSQNLFVRAQCSHTQSRII